MMMTKQKLGLFCFVFLFSVSHADTKAVNTIDYSFSNPDHSITTASQIMTKVLPKDSEEITDPEKFYPLISSCYGNTLGKVYYHFVPADKPAVAYLWFNGRDGKCYFGVYGLSDINKNLGTKRGKICPVTDIRYVYLFNKANFTSVIAYEKAGIESNIFKIFTFNTYVCLDEHNLYTEELQAMFSAN